MKINGIEIDQSWTLFLDRDGVINKKIDDDYVKKIEEFEVIPGALETITECYKVFGRVIIVTNQRGVSRGWMTANDVNAVHNHFEQLLAEKGGKVDAIYFCPDANGSPNRKPAPGMAYQAQKDFPEIDFSKSIMVGDSVSDMEFGCAVGMTNFFISEKEIEVNKIKARLTSLQQLLSI